MIGVGGVGSAASFHLAQEGVRVLGIDRFTPPHDLGSSHGLTRAIRKAHFEAPEYTPLVLRAYTLWQELEALTNTHLYRQTGLLQISPEHGMVAEGVKASARSYGLDIAELDAKTAEKMCPGIRVPQGMKILFEKDAGVLRVEACVAAHLEAAKRSGATFHFGCTVHDLSADNNSVSVTTDQGTFHTACVLVCAGAWGNAFLRELNISFRIIQKLMLWFPTNWNMKITPGCLFDLPEGYFYFLPQHDEGTLKIGEHTGGRDIRDPLQIDRNVDVMEQRRIEAFISSHLLGVSLPHTRHSICFYTQTPDDHFIIDRHPLHPHILFAAGLSGHGFKFTPTLGELLKDMALHQTPSLSIDFFKASRFDTHS